MTEHNFPRLWHFTRAEISGKDFDLVYIWNSVGPRRRSIGMKSYRRQRTAGCAFVLVVLLTGCTPSGHGNGGAATSVSNAERTPGQNVMYRGVSKHWTATFEGSPWSNSNLSQTTDSAQTLTVKYKDPNSVPTGETILWSLHTPSVKIGTATVSKSGEASSNCDVHFPLQQTVLMLTVKWGSQTETLQLRAPLKRS